jgi:hypothetical protein
MPAASRRSSFVASYEYSDSGPDHWSVASGRPSAITAADIHMGGFGLSLRIDEGIQPDGSDIMGGRPCGKPTCADCHTSPPLNAKPVNTRQLSAGRGK